MLLQPLLATFLLGEAGLFHRSELGGTAGQAARDGLWGYGNNDDGFTECALCSDRATCVPFITHIGSSQRPVQGGEHLHFLEEKQIQRGQAICPRSRR